MDLGGVWGGFGRPCWQLFSMFWRLFVDFSRFGEKNQIFAAFGRGLGMLLGGSGGGFGMVLGSSGIFLCAVGRSQGSCLLFFAIFCVFSVVSFFLQVFCRIRLFFGYF